MTSMLYLRRRQQQLLIIRSKSVAASDSRGEMKSCYHLSGLAIGPVFDSLRQIEQVRKSLYSSERRERTRSLKPI
jgi:hypothetical protein